MALRFSTAFLKHQRNMLAHLADPSARPFLDRAVWAITGEPSRLRVLASGPAAKDRLATFGCGQTVADRAWEVTVDDGTSSASLDFQLYLVQRSDGWRVWGAY